tara:strand:+ start:413 stop:898 length:486 start_codon:yes stop_codon:yes gene_type:complete
MINVAELLENNFSQIWPDWLMLNIARTRVLNEVLGNPSDAMIIQVVCWHHLLETSIEKENQTGTFDEVFDAWHEGLSPENNETKEKLLTITAISLSIALPFETVRRRVKKLCQTGWLRICDDGGVHYAPTPEHNKKIVEDIHGAERKLLFPFLAKFSKLST